MDGLLQFLPSMPDAATLGQMAMWAGGGALTVFFGWALARIGDSRSPFAGPRVEKPPPMDIPGYEPPDDEHDDWTTLRAGLQFTALGALGGALIGWGLTQPDLPDDRFQLGVEVLAVCAAAFVLARTMQDIPAVGEAPPDDPDKAHSARVRNALLKLGAAAFMLAMVWLTLD